MRWIKRTGLLQVIGLSLGLMLSSCGGSESASNTVNTGSSVSLTGVVVSVVDASNNPVSNATVTVTSKATGVATGALMTGAGSASSTTDDKGKFDAGDLAPGEYEMEFDDGKGAGTIKTTFKVDANDGDDDVEEATVAIAASQGVNGKLTKLDVIVASLSGNVGLFALGTPLEGVSVVLSSSKIGAVASDTTNANGSYALVVNVAQKNLGALANLSLTFSNDGYNTHEVTGLQMLPNTNVSGLDFGLTALTNAEVTAENALIVTSYDFANTAGWTMTGLWHPHVNGLAIKNAAVTNGLVDLAPDDTSAGLIPDAAAGTQAMWFGGTVDVNGGEIGNFLGESDTTLNTVGVKNGGESFIAKVAGTLTSPSIDLTAITAGSPVSVSFDSWWEIESENPNALGYDLMTVQYTVDAGTTWTDLARLNPLSDPVTDVYTDRSPIPYSNNGFNAAPSWVQHERISLEDPYTGVSLAGQTVQLRFAFDTVDNLFNGFRGWMIDNVEVAEVAGTYPLMDPYSLFVDAAANQGWDWMSLAWSKVLSDVDITPAMWDTTTWLPNMLPAGSATTVSGVFDYEASVAVSAQIAFAIDGGSPVAVPNSNVPLTIGGLQTVSMSAAVTPTLGNNFVDVWVQMLDGAGNIVVEMPAASYGVQ